MCCRVIVIELSRYYAYDVESYLPSFLNSIMGEHGSEAGNDAVSPFLICLTERGATSFKAHGPAAISRMMVVEVVYPLSKDGRSGFRGGTSK